MRPWLHFAAITALTLSSTAHAAGTVEVSFTEPEHFTDAGRGSLATERTVKALGDHLKTLGRQLPDGQTLRLEVLDVDLAGELRPTRSGSELRVLRGRADWPRITLRYTLLAGGRTLREGKEQLTDMNYQWMPLGLHSNDELAYEQRMLDRWFSENFKVTTATR